MNRAHLIAVAIHDPQQLNRLLNGTPSGARAGTESEVPRSQEELNRMMEAARG